MIRTPIKITATGPRGGGKTTVLLQIKQALQDVLKVEWDETEEETLIISRKPQPISEMG